jgi:hypothetical protein
MAVMGMDVLRAESLQMVNNEIAIHLLAYKMVVGFIARAASAIQGIARALISKGVLQLLVAFQQQPRWSGRKNAEIMCAILLGAISAMTLRIRPARVKPHAIKRRPKPHGLLIMPRDVARPKMIRARSAYP